MLTNNDRTHLKLLYDKLYKSNIYIKNFIENDDLESAENAAMEKEKFMHQILLFEKPRIEGIKADDELMKIRNEIIEIEKSNIQLIKSLKNDALDNFSKIKKTRKIINAYEPALNKEISTFEIREEY